MLDKLIRIFWIRHPRSGAEDTMLTLAVLATLACILKFSINDATFSFKGVTVNCGHVDSLSYAALLTPTLTAYVTRKWKDSPDKKGAPDGSK